MQTNKNRFGVSQCTNTENPKSECFSFTIFHLVSINNRLSIPYHLDEQSLYSTKGCKLPLTVTDTLIIINIYILHYLDPAVYKSLMFLF